MADRCEHGARRGTCDEVEYHNAQDRLDRIEEALLVIADHVIVQDDDGIGYASLRNEIAQIISPWDPS